MKIFKSFKFIFATALLMIGASANAYDITVDGMYYNVMSLSDLTCSVTFGDKKYTGDIIIPNKVTYNNRTLTVIAIGKSAFEGCSNLRSVTIPNSVKTIDGYAFNGCSSLTSFTIPNSVKTIGGYVFWDCSRLKKFIIEDGTETLKLVDNSDIDFFKVVH